MFTLMSALFIGFLALALVVIAAKIYEDNFAP
jgi:hypothetical protein